MLIGEACHTVYQRLFATIHFAVQELSNPGQEKFGLDLDRILIHILI